jgi:hypothetical protein
MFFKKRTHQLALWLLILLFHLNHAMFLTRYCCNRCNKKSENITLLQNENVEVNNQETPDAIVTKMNLNNVPSEIICIILNYLMNDIDSIFNIFQMNHKFLHAVSFFYESQWSNSETSLPIPKYDDPNQLPHFIPYVVIWDFQVDLKNNSIKNTVSKYGQLFIDLHFWSFKRTISDLLNKLMSNSQDYATICLIFKQTLWIDESWMSFYTFCTLYPEATFVNEDTNGPCWIFQISCGNFRWYFTKYQYALEINGTITMVDGENVQVHPLDVQ